jgi:hypothetical protein
VNERIKELARQAGLPTYNPEGIPTKLEQFAELIVKECADVVRPHVRHLANHECAEWVEEQIKQHFGVES